jgi:hypothetical protein
MSPRRKPTPLGKCRHCQRIFDMRRFRPEDGRSCGWKKSLYCSKWCRMLHRAWPWAGAPAGILSMGA